MSDKPSRFYATPAQIDAFLRKHFAEDVLLHFYNMLGEEVLDRIQQTAAEFKSLREYEQAKPVYLFGIGDVLEHIQENRYYPGELPDMTRYTRPHKTPPAPTVADWGRLKTAQALKGTRTGTTPINVTIRETPGGWVACQDGDPCKVIAESVIHSDLLAVLERFPAVVNVVGPENRTEPAEPAPEPQNSPCYRTKAHEPHDWLKGRKRAHCNGDPK